MLKRHGSLLFLSLGLFGLLGPVAAASDGELLPVWKRDGGEVHIRLAAPKAASKGLVLVSYQLVAVNTALATPEMVIARFGVTCAPKTAEPVRLMHSHTTTFKVVDGALVRERDEPVSPPKEVALDAQPDFAALPAAVACSRALAMVKASH